MGAGSPTGAIRWFDQGLVIGPLPWQVFGRSDALQRWKATDPDPVVYGYVENWLGKWEMDLPEGALPFGDADPSADPDLYMIRVPYVAVFVTFLVGSDIREQRIVIKDIES